MHYVVMFTILAATLAEFLVVKMKILPAPLKLLPEAMSAIIVLYVIVAGMTQRFRYVRSIYWLVFGTIALVMICGIIVNTVEPGPLVAGMRSYLRAIPLFFLPAVYLFKAWQIRQQLQLLLIVALAQLPIAGYQRLTLLRGGYFTGDEVFGTLMISSVLSMFLIGAACVLIGAYLRKRISGLVCVVLFFVILIPTTINETKGTLVLLPIALITTLLVGSPPKRRLRIGLSAAALLVIFGAIFVPVYDYLNRQNNPYPFTIQEFFTDPEKVETYLDKDAKVGTRGEVGRLDSIAVPFQVLLRDPVTLAFGLGIGNASHSSLGPNFIGEYFPLFGNYVLTTTAGALLLEIGLIGTLLVLTLYWLIFSDARAVARLDPTLLGAVSIAWTGITILISLATFYKTIHGFDVLSYLFWYFSGLVAARRIQFATGAASAAPSNR